MKHSLFSRLIGLVLVVAMTVSSVPMTASASEISESEAEKNVESLEESDVNEEENVSDGDATDTIEGEIGTDAEEENEAAKDTEVVEQENGSDVEEPEDTAGTATEDDGNETLDNTAAELNTTEDETVDCEETQEEAESSAYSVVRASASSYDTSISEGYYTILSDKSYVLCDGATESEIVINNSDGTRRQVLHVIEVDTKNTNVEILPSYYQIDKDLTDSGNWSAQTMEVQMDYYRDELGYNVVGGMNTALAYDSEAPSSFMVWNGEVLATPELHGNSQTYLAVTKNDDGTVECELRSTSEALHGDEWQAVSCNFGFVVKDGALVTTNVSRSDAADRSMIGIKEDGTLVICQAEGRNAPYAVGLSSYELGETMLALGCKWAVNGDGGGSSQILTKREGESDYTLRNVPSDGTPRATINGIIVASKTTPSGVFDHVSMISEHQYITPGASVKFNISGVDASGSCAELPEEGLTYIATGGVFAEGVFTSDGTVGEQTITAYHNDEAVGMATVQVVIPTSIEFNSGAMVVPYGGSVEIGVTAYYGAFEVPLTVSDVKFSFDNDTLGTLDGFMFTAVEEDAELESNTANITVILKHDNAVTATIPFSVGKGSEVIYDFEDQDLHGFYRSTNANYNYINPPGETKIVDASTGHVRNGNYAMAVEIEYSASLEAGYQLGTLVAGESKYFENAQKIGMWIYIPDEAAGLRIDPKFCQVDAEGNYVATTGGQAGIDNVGETSKTEVGFVYGMEESGWRYITIDLSSYEHSAILEGRPIMQFYVSQKDGVNGYSYGDQKSVNGNFTFYIDDITIDYSSAVDDREAPVFSGINYTVAGMDEGLAMSGQTIDDHTVSFTATVAENTDKDNYTGIDTVSGEAYIDGVDYSSSLTWSGNSKMTLTNITLAEGRHEVRFGVCDRMGNYSSVIRDITIGSSDNAPVKVVAHETEADKILLGSVYNIDVVASEIEDVQSVEVCLDLNNISSWEFEGMDVVLGFEAEYSIVEDENIATVTITRTSANTQTGEQVLASIPTRTWQLPAVTAIYGHAGKVWMYPNYKAGNEILPMDLSVETDGGVVVFTDGSSASFASPRIQVDTELYGNAYTSSGSAANNYIRNDEGYAEWNGGHDHRTEMAQYYAEDATNVAVPIELEDKEATCTEDGYTGRTYCEVCESVVEWGTVIPKTGHKYTLINGLFVCDCGDVNDTGNKNGLVESEGKLYYFINGVLKSGWIVDGVDYYYFSPETFAAVDGEQTLTDGFTYTFENNVLVKGALVTDENGTRYRWAGRWVYNEWIEVEGKKYYIDQDTYAETGIFVVSNDGKRYVSDENGVWLENYVGFFDVNGKTYYCENGVLNLSAGLVQIEDSYYYFNSSGVMVIDATVWVAQKNILPEGNGYYTFDEEGKLVKTSFVTGGGNTYYYDNLVKARGLTKIGEDYYYFNTSNGKMYANTTLWVGSSNAYGLAAGYYEFQKDGKMYVPNPDGPKAVIEEDGKLYFTVDGVKQKNGLNELDGEYYYATSSGVLAQGATIWVSQVNDLIDQTGYYAFDTEGKMLKTGFVTGGGNTYYYDNLVKAKGLTKIGEDYYYFNVSSGKMYANTTLWVGSSNAYGFTAGYYEFQKDGKMYVPNPDGPKAVIEEDGKLYFTVDGVKQKNGLNELDGEYYYATSSGVLAQGATIWVSQVNDLIDQTGYYAFDTEGKMLKTGFVTGGGNTYYYDNLVKAKGLTKIGEDYYYFNVSSGKMYASTTLWVGSSNAYGFTAGYYEFQKDGTMLIK